MVTGAVVVLTGLLESVAVTVTVVEPAVVGVPVTTQPLLDKPGGSVPAAMVQL
jgi:hypothetical protein